jgi:hypothetical protein
MPFGPIELLVVRFPGDQFTGEIMLEREKGERPATARAPLPVRWAGYPLDGGWGVRVLLGLG